MTPNVDSESARLAGGAVVARPVLDGEQLDLGTASQAVVPFVCVGGFAAFDADAIRNVEFRPFDGDDATVLDSLAQHRRDRDPERLQLGDIQIDARLEWVDAADEECLGAIHVADPSDH
jgi:hypothetical protein